MWSLASDISTGVLAHARQGSSERLVKEESERGRKRNREGENKNMLGFD